LTTVAALCTTQNINLEAFLMVKMVKPWLAFASLFHVSPRLLAQTVPLVSRLRRAESGAEENPIAAGRHELDWERADLRDGRGL
jgi:hypothetical protein